MTLQQKLQIIDAWRADSCRTVQWVAAWATRQFGFTVSRDEVRELVEGRER